MVRIKPFDKRTATTYALVHRPAADPLYHDADAPAQVFTEISTSRKTHKTKVKQRGDLEEEFGFSTDDLRANEGEAAEHGVYYDDTKYDYMQHLRDLGNGGGDATWLEPRTSAGQVKGNGKQNLEDALRDSTLCGNSDEQSKDKIINDRQSRYAQSTYSNAPQRSAYEQQVEVPDAISGFRPDLDPRLREVLEALDDEEYVEDNDDVFKALAGNGAEEVDEYEFEDSAFFEGDDEGWESDHTTTATATLRNEVVETSHALPDCAVNMHHDENAVIDDPATTNALPSSDAPAPDLPAGSDWAFLNCKTVPSQELKPLPLPSTFPIRPRPNITPSDVVSLTSSAVGRKKKRKGALTSDTGFTMTSSSVARTESLTTLDARFDKIAASYMNELAEEEEDDDFPSADNMSAVSGVTGISKLTDMTAKTRKSAWAAGSTTGSVAPSLVSVSANGGGEAGFNSVMDEFLGSAAGRKGRRMKKGGRAGIVAHQTGLEQLDEIRNGLGAARFSSLGRNGRSKV